MKFTLNGYGSRGDVEPCAVVGLELLRRGHEVRMAVAPNMVGFVESVGLAAVAYGPDTRWGQIPADIDASAFAQNPLGMLTQGLERAINNWAELTTQLTSLADGADLLVSGIADQDRAVNIAEYHGIPLATLHYSPAPILLLQRGPRYSFAAKEAEDAQRRALGLPEAGPLTGRASLEIQAYDGFCFPALPPEWTEDGARRPFVGALTLELPADTDDEVLTWIAEGSPPIYFGFGSVQVPAETVAMVSAACAQLGERALVCAGWSDFTHANPNSDHVKIVGAVNHAAIFPACRAVVHHGGTGTTAASLRAGIPTLILPTSLEQKLWAYVVSHLEVGCGRPFFQVTQKSLVADLLSILTPHCAVRAREVATQMSKPAESAARAADLLEETAKSPR